MFHFYLGPWQQVRRNGFTFREMPGGAIAALDLTPPASPATRNLGLFVAPRPLLQPELAYLGQGLLNKTLTPADKSAIASLAGYRPAANRLGLALIELCTSGADPDGRTGPTGLVPDESLRLELALGHPQLRLRIPHDVAGPYQQKLERRYQRDIRRLVNAGMMVESQKYLGAILRRYRIPREQYTRFVPPELRKEHPGPAKPTTYFFDDFNRTSLGSNWVVVAGGLEIASNRVQPTTGGKTSQYNWGHWASQVSDDDQYAELELYQAGSSYGGPVCRWDGQSSLTAYYAEMLTGGGAKLFRWNGGTATQLHSSSPGWTDGAVIRVQAVGSTISYYKSGTTLGSVTDSSPITGNFYVGLGIYYDASANAYLQGDNWAGADFTEAVTATSGAGATTRVAGTSVPLSQGSGAGASANASGSNRESVTATSGAGATVRVAGSKVPLTQGSQAGAQANVAVSTVSLTQDSGAGATAGEPAADESLTATSQTGEAITAQRDHFGRLYQDSAAGAQVSEKQGYRQGMVEDATAGASIQATQQMRESLQANSAAGAQVSESLSYKLQADSAAGASIQATQQMRESLQADSAAGAYVGVIHYCEEGRKGIGITQQQSAIDYPLIGPVEDSIRYLIADAHFHFDDPGDYTGSCYRLPFKLAWLYGVGETPNSPPSWAPAPTHAVDLVVQDADGNTVIDTTLASTFVTRDITGRLRLYAWEGDNFASWIVVHTCWSPGEQPTITPQTYQLHIAPNNAIIDPRCIFRRGRTVRKVSVNGTDYAGKHVVFKAGYNLAVATEGQELVGLRRTAAVMLEAVPGAGAGRYDDCSNAPPAYVRTVNGIGPDRYGVLNLSADGCLFLSRLDNNGNWLDGAVQLENVCGPTCPPEEFVSVADFTRSLGDQYAAIGQAAEAVRDLYHQNRQRWLDAKCCLEQYPIRVAIQPQLCPYIDVAGQFVNMTGQCVKNVKLKFHLEIPNDPDKDDPVLAIKGEALPGFTTIKRKVPGEIRVSGQIERYTLQGSWPDYEAQWDEVEPKQEVWVQFRLMIGNCGMVFPQEPARVKVSLTGEVDGQPVQAVIDDKSGSTTGDCPGTTQTVVRTREATMRCPADDDDFFDPQPCT